MVVLLRAIKLIRTKEHVHVFILDFANTLFAVLHLSKFFFPEFLKLTRGLGLVGVLTAGGTVILFFLCSFSRSFQQWKFSYIMTGASCINTGMKY